MATFEHLLEWRNAVAKEAEARGERMFMGRPDIWHEDPHWFCKNGHVSGRYLKSEARGGILCLACEEPVVLGPPIGEAEFKPILEKLGKIRIVFRSSKRQPTGLP